MYIVFDIGASNLRLASSTDGKTLKKVEIFPTPQNFDEAMALLSSEANKLAEGQPIKAISGGIAGKLNGTKSAILQSANLPDWSGKSITKKLEQIFLCPVTLENDCALGALGESEFGEGKNYKNIIYVAVGTGIGGAWIVNNQLVEGSYSFDIGHQIIDPNGPLCASCQQLGHLEAYKNMPNFKKYFSIGLYNTTVHWPSDVIIISGGTVLKGNWKTQEIESELNKLDKFSSHEIPIKITKLGDEVGLYGALTRIDLSST